jgi:predicted RNA binding protein YcfA (HicA-like mRNA interferase family)
VDKDSRDIIRELEADGWRFVGAAGSHHHFKHPTKPGKVTVTSAQGLASQDGKVDLSAVGIDGTAVRR